MVAKSLYVLHEHASGFALFRVKEFEEIGMLLPEVESSVTDLSRFNSIVSLVAFSPFKSGTNALDNINSISEGILHEDLRVFLESNFPKSSKKEKSTLGVGDSKLGSAISEEMGFSCLHTGVVPEIIRGIRMHFHKMVKGLTDLTASKAQLGLGHSYSRCKVKFNVNRVDNMIIQSICLLDQLDKDINIFSMRMREWYSYHFPELMKIVTDNHMYARLAKMIGDRKTLDDEKMAAIEEVTMDAAKAQEILTAAKASMGMDISPIDLINIETFAVRVIALADYRKGLITYLKERMHQVAPSLTALVGEQVGARLISHAGSLTSLAKFPASTVQILGAEKALFRALKTRSNTPKYGLIFHSSFISRAAMKNKGRISRFLANKCSIASRIDCFSDVPTPVFGEHLRDQVEERLTFYETGDAPQKNVDVMKTAIGKAAEEAEAARLEKKNKKKEKKKAKKRKAEEKSQNGDTSLNTTGAADTTMEMEEEGDEPAAKKQKKKKKKAKKAE
ncbi:hypothetical protein CAPTEDRAFT_159443 [Capitella teleta]|uniref:Nucleolar protein 56 n=1 Tax=Capitella teleta TaxID=283909 RepID=R7TLZ9_CAPTE|nr:hypothetical protein CAPTEDRAFT_159443 [Capitella teleta]|eukprot:ELT94557.1 hypothetical protein CAPTEDRAFT_159443 [Capitella teleta]